mmetsp:Transcript_9197/g.16108  ORF Transcript_9197/g.16108 Transcript_9197/m.16108 type:complete len:102 (+) Transcript_9197:174-479(+)
MDEGDALRVKGALSWGTAKPGASQCHGYQRPASFASVRLEEMWHLRFLVSSSAARRLTTAKSCLPKLQVRVASLMLDLLAARRGAFQHLPKVSSQFHAPKL